MILHTLGHFEVASRGDLIQGSRLRGVMYNTVSSQIETDYTVAVGADFAEAVPGPEGTDGIQTLWLIQHGAVQ